MFSSAYIEVTGTIKEFLTLHFRIQKAIGGLLCAGLSVSVDHPEVGGLLLFVMDVGLSEEWTMILSL